MSYHDFDISADQFDYSCIGLRENPFPYSPVPADEPSVYCGQGHVATAVSDTVSSVLATGKSKHLVITGRYGNGKSHTLKFARSLVRDRSDVIAGYVAQPGEGFLDIYHEFMVDLGFERVRDLSYEFLARVAQDETSHNPSSGEEMEVLIDDGEVLLSELIPPAVQGLSDITKFADFARAIVHMLYHDTNLYAWQWLTGEGIRYEQRKEMEIHSALDDDTMAVRAFTAFKHLILKLDHTAVFVFIDEFESIARLSPKVEQSTLNSIRHLMDQNNSGLCVMFGCAPEVWQDIMSEYHAFSERIGREVALRPLSEDDLPQFIDSYLETLPGDATCQDVFTEGALDRLLESSQGNMRQVLTTCSYSLDEAAHRDSSLVDETIIETVIQ